MFLPLNKEITDVGLLHGEGFSSPELGAPGGSAEGGRDLTRIWRGPPAAVGAWEAGEQRRERGAGAGCRRSAGLVVA